MTISNKLYPVKKKLSFINNHQNSFVFLKEIQFYIEDSESNMSLKLTIKVVWKSTLKCN